MTFFECFSGTICFSKSISEDNSFTRLKSPPVMSACIELWILCILYLISMLYYTFTQAPPRTISYLCIYCTSHIYIIVHSPLAMFACTSLYIVHCTVSSCYVCLSRSQRRIPPCCLRLCTLTLYTVYYIYGIFLLYTIYTLAVCYIICILLLYTICLFMKKFPNNPVKKLRAYYTL